FDRIHVYSLHRNTVHRRTLRIDGTLSIARSVEVYGIDRLLIFLCSDGVVDGDGVQFDVSVDIEGLEVGGLSSVHEGGESLAVHEDLQGELLVDDGEVEHFSLLHGQFSVSLLLAPHVVGHGVSHDDSLVETDGELKRVLQVLAKDIDVEALAGGHSGDVESLAGDKVGDGRVGVGEVRASVVEETQLREISTDRDVIDSIEGLADVELADVLAVGEHVISLVDDSDAQVKVLVGLQGVIDALLVLAPVAVQERVVDELGVEEALVEADREVEGHIGILVSALVEVEVDSGRLLVDLAERVDGLAVDERLYHACLERKTEVLLADEQLVVGLLRLLRVVSGLGLNLSRRFVSGGGCCGSEPDQEQRDQPPVHPAT
ncbi:hypothetical protein PENTCL1PPCAC_7795, partial [Pristionchus entomophagus]